MTAPYLYAFGELTTDLTVAYDYDANSNLIYQGWTQPGNLKSNTGWRIMRQIFNSSNKVTDLLWPQDSGGNTSTAFNFVWNLRTSYNYGLGAGIISYTAFILTSPNTTRWSVIVLPTGNLQSSPLASGPAGAYDVGNFALTDSNSVPWTLTISDTGDLATSNTGSPSVVIPNLNLLDSNNRIWILTVSTNGNLITT